MTTTNPASGVDALDCSGLRKRYGDTVAVDNATFRVAEGEILSLLGPSGCGKTTCLRLIAGFERPDAGTVRLNGRLVAGEGVLVPPERRRVGMVFQDYALFPNRTVRGNVRYGLEAERDATSRTGGWAGRLRRDDGGLDARVDEVLAMVSLTGKADRYPHELSGGEAQRVALARALAPNPSLILFDEPFSNLDTSLRVAVRTEVRAILKRAGTAAVFVTHDQDEAFSLADRVAVMWDGHIAQIGTPQTVYRTPANRDVAEFVGEADWVPGAIHGDHVRTEIGDLPLPHGAHTQPSDRTDGADTADTAESVEVLVRPERIRLALKEDAPALVEGREYFGHDQLVRVRLPSGRIVRVRLGPDDEFTAGDHVAVALTGEAVVFAAPPDRSTGGASGEPSNTPVNAAAGD